MNPPAIRVRLVQPDLIRPLRHRVLRPDQPFSATLLPQDDRPEALHLAAYTAYAADDAATVLACASACRETLVPDEQRPDVRLSDDPATHWRIRSVASAEEARGAGYGAAVMRGLIGLILRVSAGEPVLIWFDARTPAMDFYRHLGFEARGGEYIRHLNGAEYPHFTMARVFTAEEGRAYLADEAVEVELPPLYPLKLRPALHAKVWGGRKLETVLGKMLPTDAPYGESWEMHDSATIAGGALAGRSVGSALALYGRRLPGASGRPDEGMPLLAKFLDAEEWLSVQVHPNDAQAAQLEGEPRGKTEAWYVLEADPGARLVLAVQPGVPREQLAAAIRENRLEDLLVYAEAVPGDVLMNHAGGIHALGPGLLIYEIQQSSDVTYRLYDWGRVDLNGQPRELHIEKGLEVANTAQVPELVHTADDPSPVLELVNSPYFRTLLHQMAAGEARALELGGVFHILTNVGGTCTVEAETGRMVLAFGETALLPAELAGVRLHAGENGAKLLDSSEPAAGG